MLIQVDNDGVITTRLHWDEHTESIHVERTQDVEPLLERNKALKAAGWDGFNDDRTLQATHEIPLTVLEQLGKEGLEWWNPAHDAEIRRRINDPALNGFRIGTPSANPGRIIVKGTK